MAGGFSSFLAWLWPSAGVAGSRSSPVRVKVTSALSGDVVAEEELDVTATVSELLDRLCLPSRCPKHRLRLLPRGSAEVLQSSIKLGDLGPERKEGEDLQLALQLIRLPKGESRFHFSKGGPSGEGAPRFHILVVGDVSVGKTSLTSNFTTGQSEMPPCNIGVDFNIVTLTMDDGNPLKLLVWDSAGQERFARHLLNRLIQRQDGVLLAYDLTDRESFVSLKAWVEAIKELKPTLPFVFVGNKLDLEASRVVSAAEAEELAAEMNTECCETSAKTGDGVDAAFFKLVEQIMESRC